MLPVSALKSMRVMFATPCYISAVTMNYVASIFSMALDSAHLGLPCVLHLHSESLIPRGRNKMVIKFLSEEFTHLFWIDSDIAFNPQSVFRLLLADRDIAAGVYPMKNFKWPAEGVPAGTTQKLFEDRYGEYPFNPIDHGASRVSPYVDDEGFVEVAEAPTGFMAIKRHVFSAMMKHYPELNYVPDGPPTIRRRTCIGVSSTVWSIPIPGDTCPRTTHSAGDGATRAARSGSISTASSCISGSTCSAAISPRACARKGVGKRW
jgi:hypothetical protein